MEKEMVKESLGLVGGVVDVLAEAWRIPEGVLGVTDGVDYLYGRFSVAIVLCSRWTWKGYNGILDRSRSFSGAPYQNLAPIFGGDGFGPQKSAGIVRSGVKAAYMKKRPKVAEVHLHDSVEIRQNRLGNLPRLAETRTITCDCADTIAAPIVRRRVCTLFPGDTKEVFSIRRILVINIEGLVGSMNDGNLTTIIDLG